MDWRGVGQKLNLAGSFLAVAWWVYAAIRLWQAFSQSGGKLLWYDAIYLLLTVAVSLLAFVLFGIDKRRAVRDCPRISERTLLLSALCCGWPGSMLGAELFRHKTVKWSFRTYHFAIVLAHWGLIGYIGYVRWFPTK